MDIWSALRPTVEKQISYIKTTQKHSEKLLFDVGILLSELNPSLIEQFCIHLFAQSANGYLEHFEAYCGKGKTLDKNETETF